MSTDGNSTGYSVEPVGDGSPGGVAPNVRRRRLLVTAIGALPSVYTLASGAHTAASSHLACWAQQPLTNPPRFTTGTDTWLRSKVYCGSYDGHPAYCVSNPQNSCVDALHSSKGGDGSAWIYNNSNYGGSSGDMRIVVGQGHQVTNVSHTPPTHGLVYVDQNLTLTTLDPNGKSYLHPVSASCWTSIMGGKTTNLG